MTSSTVAATSRVWEEDGAGMASKNIPVRYVESHLVGSIVRRRARTGGGLTLFFTLPSFFPANLLFSSLTRARIGSSGRAGRIFIGRTTRPEGVTVHPGVFAASAEESGVDGKVDDGWP